ncbi:MAG: type II toxin-antitoxin system VapC family toxin [Rickettsiales bacterium]|nr:MAG: type II toxin-antitoxin system VapC family toxin [Rickettsiales bacterium]
MQQNNDFSEPILLDTHILIWSMLSPDKITPQQQSVVRQALIKNELYISSITLWEIAMLIAKGRINVFTRIDDFLKSIENIKGLQIYQINSLIAADSVSLPGEVHGDPADRIIMATCRELGATLITADESILSWAKQGYIKVYSDL